jgi:hypothetical protein
MYPLRAGLRCNKNLLFFPTEVSVLVSSPLPPPFPLVLPQCSPVLTPVWRRITTILCESEFLTWQRPCKPPPPFFKGCPTFLFGKGPQALLNAGLRPARIQITISVIRHSLNYYVIFRVYIIFHQQTGLKFKEETIKVLHLGHCFVWCWNVDTSENRSEVSGKFWNVVLEKNGDQLDRSCVKWRSITESRRREISYIQ